MTANILGAPVASRSTAEQQYKTGLHDEVNEEKDPNSAMVVFADNAQVPMNSLKDSIAALIAESDPMRREELLDNLANSFPEDDLAKILVELRKQPWSDLHAQLELRLIRRWAGKDPVAAAQGLDNLFETPELMPAIETVAIQWASQDLASVITWIQTLSGLEKITASKAAANEAIYTDPRQALILVETLPKGSARDDLLTRAASEWAVHDMNAAVDWALQIKDEALYSSVISSIAKTWGAEDPKLAATLATMALNPGRSQDSAVAGVAQQWVQKDPQEAIRWVTRFPEGHLRRCTLEMLVNLWADQDLDRVGTWVKTLQDDPDRDTVIFIYANKVALHNPLTAAGYAESINETKIKYSAMEAVARHWLLRDPAAARVWILQSSLPETQKTSLLAERKH